MARTAKEEVLPFEVLANWIKAKESENENLRVSKVVTNDPEAPETVRLKYSHAFVEQGSPGYKILDGGFYAYE